MEPPKGVISKSQVRPTVSQDLGKLPMALSGVACSLLAPVPLHQSASWGHLPPVHRAGSVCVRAHLSANTRCAT